MKNLTELSITEIQSIDGGSWLSYWAGYIAGTIVAIGEAWVNSPEAQQALRDFQ